MEAKEKAEILVSQFMGLKEFNSDFESSGYAGMDLLMAKECALIATSNEYHQLREQLVNLRSCKVIESENVYLTRLQNLIDEEAAVKQAIEDLC